MFFIIALLLVVLAMVSIYGMALGYPEVLLIWLVVPLSAIGLGYGATLADKDTGSGEKQG